MLLGENEIVMLDKGKICFVPWTKSDECIVSIELLIIAIGLNFDFSFYLF